MSPFAITKPTQCRPDSGTTRLAAESRCAPAPSNWEVAVRAACFQNCQSVPQEWLVRSLAAAQDWGSLRRNALSCYEMKRSSAATNQEQLLLAFAGLSEIASASPLDEQVLAMP